MSDHAHHGCSHGAAKARDPVCGMEVDPSTDLRADHKGTTYFFCHPSCLERFTADPAEFLEPRTPDVPVPDAFLTPAPEALHLQVGE